MSTNTQEVEWSGGAMTGLVIATLIIPLVGIVAGLFGLSQPGKQDQAKILLAAGVLAGLFWFARMSD